MDGGWGVQGGLADRQRAQAVTHAELSDSHQHAGPIATIWHLGPGHHGQLGRPFISKEMYGETERCFFSPAFPLYNKFLVNVILLGFNFNLHYQLYRLTACVSRTLPLSISGFNYVEWTKENYNRCLCCAAGGLNENRKLKGEKSHETKHKLHKMYSKLICFEWA